MRRRIDRDRQVFVAEGALVLQALLASPYRLRSVLASPARQETAEALVAGRDVPIYVAPAEVLAEVAGFNLHRGLVALGERRPPVDLWTALAGQRLALVVEGVNDHENLGALFRNAAAFGAGAVVLDPTTADPLYRRCLRVSLGHALNVATARSEDWPTDLGRLAERGWAVLALTPHPEAEDLSAAAASLDPARPVALLVGAEGPGLTAGALAGGRAVRIPMAPGVDSLNVATSAAVALSVLAWRSR